MKSSSNSFQLPSFIVWMSRIIVLKDNKIPLYTKKSHHNVLHTLYNFKLPALMGGPKWAS